MKLRTSIVAVVAVISSLAMFAPTAHAAGACASARVTVNGSDVVNESVCLP